MSIASLFKETMSKFPDKAALEFEGQKVTFRELDSKSSRAANAFQSLGIAKGDCVAHFLPNSLELIYSILGNFKNGSIVVPMNAGFKGQEAEHILKDSGAKAIITDRERLHIIKNISKNLPELKYIILTDGTEEGTLNFCDLMKNASDKTPKAIIRDEDYSIIFYTSGTTGKPKGAALNQINVTSNVKALAQAWKWTKDDVFLLALPLYHIHGIGVALCGSFYAGNTIILKKKFEAEDVINTIQKRKITLFMGVPTMYFKLMEAKNSGNCDVSSMRLFVSGSAPMPKELFMGFKKKFGKEVLERAGMSESMMNFSNPYDGKRIPGSVGPCLPGINVRITDKNFAELPQNSEGEILIKGKNVFHGYWKRPELNSEIFRDGWFVTGDVGKIDENGYVYIVGRSKDVIISGGINIYPREIEELIESLPEVKECAVIGISNKEFGESVKAFVVLNENQKLSQNQVISHCKEKLASFKKPKSVEFISSLPKNTMGKILKEELRKKNT
ncbi:MAG TPA: long-chain-fatty-acid--CoA ligase [Candidatus Nanoarchaeia archaeon]|nr:long-chain-fatty-acid--CoA ligase [Candidatus Nanoarchaeia archaeon]